MFETKSERDDNDHINEFARKKINNLCFVSIKINVRFLLYCIYAIACINYVRLSPNQVFQNSRNRKYRLENGACISWIFFNCDRNAFENGQRRHRSILISSVCVLCLLKCTSITRIIILLDNTLCTLAMSLIHCYNVLVYQFPPAQLFHLCGRVSSNQRNFGRSNYENTCFQETGKLNIIKNIYRLWLQSIYFVDNNRREIMPSYLHISIEMVCIYQWEKWSSKWAVCRLCIDTFLPVFRTVTFVNLWEGRTQLYAFHLISK